MIIMAWNCRGLGQPRAVGVLSELIRAQRPDVVFLSETLISNGKLEEVRVAVRFEGNWRLTGFYGCPERERRGESWSLLRELAGGTSGPWCIIGDFNDILSQTEQRGRFDRPQNLIDGFRGAVADCNLMDVAFTWARARGKPHGIESRLDRAMVNPEWGSLFSQAKLTSVAAPLSDHVPLILNTRGRKKKFAKRTFRYENNWKGEADVRAVVEGCWQAGGGRGIFGKLEICAERLEEWGNRRNAADREDLQRVSARLDELRGESGEGVAEEEIRCKEEFITLVQRKQAYWKQRAKQFWLKDGDKNTKFFHAMENARRKKRIGRLRDDNGRWVTKQEELEELAHHYFSGIFTTGGCSPETVTDVIDGQLTRNDFDILDAEFTKEEFTVAVFSMAADKAPGPDGFNPGFYQHYWDVIGDEVFRHADGG
ncbi:Transposon TX1 uncharacterized 149 kDa protein [Linum perenne]